MSLPLVNNAVAMPACASEAAAMRRDGSADDTTFIYAWSKNICFVRDLRLLDGRLRSEK